MSTQPQTHDVGPFRITVLPILGDNYCFLLEWSDGLAVVDPGEAEPVLAFVEASGKTLQHVLLTHYHPDHTSGVSLVCSKTGCREVLGPAEGRISAVNVAIADSDRVPIGPVELMVMATPGHSRCDVSLYAEKEQVVFVGDTLFCGGCGRMFDGPPDLFHHSIQKLAELPGATRMFCGHEYTIDNLNFSRMLGWRDLEITERLHRVEEGLQRGRPSVPSTLGIEKRTNPFLNADDVELRQILGMESEPSVKVFAELRARKDRF